MGLFGGSTKTKTEVKPSKQVSSILQDVATRSNNLASNMKFTPYELAQMTPAQQGALAQLAASPELQQASALLSGQTQQGLDTLSRSSDLYRQLAGSGVGAQDVNSFRNSLTGADSLSSRATAQGTNAAGASRNLGNSAALRSANRFNTANTNALMQNQRGQQAAGIGASTLLGNLGYGQNVAGLQANLGSDSLRLGAQGVQMGQQAIQNQLNAGNQQQQYNQLQNNVAWQNAMGQNMFDWNKINNQLNVLNTISPMAGYSATGTTPNISKFQQLAGAGLTGIGVAGRLGAFSSANPFSGLSQGQVNQAYNTGLDLGGMDTPANYATNMQSVRNSASNMGGGSGFMNTNLGQGLSNAWGSLSGLF